MDMNTSARQMIEFQKVAFNSAFNTIAMFQDQSEKTISTLMDQNPLLTKQNKDAFTELGKVGKKARDDYKKAIDDGFKSFENYFTNMFKS